MQRNCIPVFPCHSFSFPSEYRVRSSIDDFEKYSTVVATEHMGVSKKFTTPMRYMQFL